MHTCNICKKQLSTNYDLSRHITSKHMSVSSPNALFDLTKKSEELLVEDVSMLVVDEVAEEVKRTLEENADGNKDMNKQIEEEPVNGKGETDMKKN